MAVDAEGGFVESGGKTDNLREVVSGHGVGVPLVAHDVELAKVEDTPGAAALAKHVTQRRKWLAQAAEKATADGKLDPTNSKYRTARKRVKRAQRRLRRARARVGQVRVKVGTPAGDAAQA